VSLCFAHSAFFFAAYDEPYLLALLTDGIEIRTVEPRLFVQSVTVPKPRLVVRCHQGLVYVASVGHVWCLQAVPLARQIRVLLEDKQFQLALKLTVCIIIMIRLYLRCQIHYGSWGFYIYIFGIGWLGSTDVKLNTERKEIGSNEFLVSWKYFLWTFSVI
jgi:hypothetical protein